MAALHGLVGGLAIRLLINPGPDFRQQALRVIETTIDDLRRGRGQRAWRAEPRPLCEGAAAVVIPRAAGLSNDPSARG